MSDGRAGESWTRHGLTPGQVGMVMRASRWMGARIYASLDRSGLSAREVSRALGLGDGAIGNWTAKKAPEGAPKTIPNGRELCLLGHELNVEPAEFMPPLAIIRGESTGHEAAVQRFNALAGAPPAPTPGPAAGPILAAVLDRLDNQRLGAIADALAVRVLESGAMGDRLAGLVVDRLADRISSGT